MRKNSITNWLVALAVGAVASAAFAQEKVFTDNSQVLYRTNVTLTATTPVKLVGVASGGANVRAITATGSNAQIKVYLSTSATASATVTNNMSALNGVYLLGGTNSAVSTWGVTEKEFSRAKGNFWEKYIYISSADGTGTVSYVELGY